MNRLAIITLALLILLITGCAKPEHVPIHQHFWVPNTFSPNNDGLNETFNVHPVYGYHIKEYHLTIYDQYFQEVYTSDDLNDQWNGKYNGVEMPDGNYDYQIIYQSSQLLDSTSTDSIYSDFVTSSTVTLHRD